MNFDWTDGDKVVSINPENDSIVSVYDVGTGPGDLLVHNNEIYVSRTSYDENWNAFYGTSKIESDGDVIIANYGGGMACGGSVHAYEGEVYRVFDGGIARLDDNLEIIPETRIGNFNPGEVYSVEVIDEHIYFGLSDFTAPDEVIVLNSNGLEVANYSVGVAPGDFVKWEPCNNSGDLNADESLNIYDIVLIVSHVLNNSLYDCVADINSDSEINVVDIVLLVQEILDIDTFRGAANWLKRHFPELRAETRLKAFSDKKL